jgi:probable O-glycosylation ligase (exosortase A-associated)
MLRLTFVYIIIIVGAVFAVQGPFYALLFYLWNAYFRPEQWVWYDYVSPLNVSLIVGVFLVATSLKETRNFRIDKTVALVVGFLFQATLSLFTSEYFDWSLHFWIEFLKVVIITVLITFLVSDQRRYRTTLLVIGLSLGFEQAKQGWAQLVLNPGATNNNPHPVLGDNNGVAVGMMMLVPVFLALAQTAVKRKERYFHRFFVAGLIYRGISTYSRGGFLAGAAMGLLALYRSPRKISALISVAILGFVIYSAMPQSFWDRMNSIRAEEGERDASAESRLFVWGVALDMAAAKPLTGVGFNAFPLSYPRYDPSAGKIGEAKAAHSAWFGVLAETGYPGFVLYVLIILSAFHLLWRTRRLTKGRHDLKNIRVYATTMQMSLVAYVVGVTFLSGQYNEMFWHFIGLSVALDRITAKALATAPGTLPEAEKAAPPGAALPRVLVRS